jgi:hypothetical protein
VDLDGDGINDLVSGSWPGEVFFFKGHGQGQFDVPLKLKNKAGKSINIGGGIRRNDEHELLIAGDAKFEQADGKQYIVYEGERIEFKPNQQGGITGTASAVHVADLNSDGTLDLIVGTINGDVYCVPNEGSAKAWVFGKERTLMAGGEVLQTDGTENHLLLVDVRKHGLNGRQAEAALRECDIVLNRNVLPYDPNGPWFTSGIRLGTAALTTRGLGEDEMGQIARLITTVLKAAGPIEDVRGNPEPPDALVDEVRGAVEELTAAYPLYPGLVV